jgi:hypothetical protein
MTLPAVKTVSALNRSDLLIAISGLLGERKLAAYWEGRLKCTIGGGRNQHQRPWLLHHNIAVRYLLPRAMWWPASR